MTGKAKSNPRNRPAKSPAPATPAPQPAAPARVLALWPHLIVVFLLPWLLYSSTLNAGFIWDDHNLIESRGPSATFAELASMWGSDFWQTASSNSQYYRPLTSSTFWLDRALFGLSPRAFHFTNLLLYSLTCAAAWMLFLRLLGAPLPALLAALLFAAAPAHVENAAWISGRTDIIAALFMFASFSAFLDFDESGRRSRLATALGLFFVGLLGKEMALTLVPAVALQQWLYRGWKPAARRAAPFVAVAAFYWVLHSRAAGGSGIENLYHTAGARALNVLRNLSLGVWLSYVPGGFEYLITATREEAGKLFPLPSGGALLTTLLPLVAALAGLAAALWKRERLIALGLGAGLLALVPVSGVIPIGVVFANRFLLIPGFFFLLAAGGLLKLLPERRPVGAPLAALVAAPLIGWYAVTTLLWAPAWRTDATLMEAALKKAPDASLAHFLRGNGLGGEGRIDEAIAEYQRAISLRPNYPEALYNLGTMAERQGNAAAAAESYRRCLALNPAYAPARAGLARVSRP